MSTSKKPGTDLAALKARLAKKTKGADPAPAPAASPMAAPDVPPPGQVATPAAMPDVPPPGQPYMEQSPAPSPAGPAASPFDQPAAAPIDPAPYSNPPASAPMNPVGGSGGGSGGDPFGGGSAMGGFDPDAGLIDGGDVKPRGSKGLVVFAMLLGVGVGAMGGWLGHKIISVQERIDQGRAKGEKMVAQVTQIKDARASVSLAMEDLKKEIAQDPAASAQKVTTLLTENFDKQPQMNELFGWQLASVDSAGVRATFQLYDQVSDLQRNLGLLAKFLTNYGSVMKVGGPSLFGLTYGSGGAQMVAITQPMCGSLPDNAGKDALAALKPCDPSASANASAYQISDFNGEPKIVPRGTGEGYATLLLAEGRVYDYAIGIEPGKNAANFYTMMMNNLNENLEEMNKAEERSLTALKKYAEDPNVDGPAPSAGGGAD